MKRLVLTAVTLNAAILLTPEPVAASFLNGNELLRSCSTPSANQFYDMEVARCLGYILGAYDALEIKFADRPQKFCAPSNLVAGQIRDIVIQYIEKNPEHRHYPAGGIVLLAMSNAFPCQPQAQ